MIDDASPLLPAGNSDALWIGNAELADLSGISARMATEAMRNCLSGKTWRGKSLDVRKAPNPAGTGGSHLQVFVPSLPNALSQAWHDKNPDIFTPTKAAVATVSFSIATVDAVPQQAVSRAKWKESIIALALPYPHRSKQRAAAIKSIAGQLHTDPRGQKVRIPEKTLYGWIAAYEKPEHGGLPALVRKQRHDTANRVVINRTWDEVCPLNTDLKTKIAGEITTYIKSLWASGVRGWAKVDQLASTKLMQLCHSAGWQTATLENCRLGRHAVERFADYKLVAIREKDAKRFADLFQPRVIRSHINREPMEIVFGDVHPIDIYLTREDGSPVTPRLIAWYDLATHRLHATLVLLDKGKGITQAHIASAFANMVSDWGLPLRLYLDNGKEYSWNEMIQGFETLTGLVMNFKQFTADLLTSELAESFEQEADGCSDREQNAVVRARPYNAAAKPIEGAFAVLETYLASLPGWVGGDRMNKKTENVGKAPIHFPGNLEAFHAAFGKALAWYHATPQGKRSNLKGLSPNEIYKVKIEAGWQPIGCPREVLIFAMSETRTAKVHNRGIEVDGTWYEGPELAGYRQRKVTVQHAKWAADRLILHGKDGFSWIPRAPIFDALDQQGAIHLGRQQKVMTNLVNGMKSETHRLDMPAEIARHVDALPNAPETPPGLAIDLAPGLQRLIDSSQQSPAVAPQKARILQAGQSIDPITGEVRDAFEQHYQESNKKLGGVATPPNPLDQLVTRYGT